MMATSTTAATIASNITTRGPCTGLPRLGGGSLGGRSTILTGPDGTARRSLLVLSALVTSELDGLAASGSRDGIDRMRAVRIPSLDITVGAVAIATSCAAGIALGVGRADVGRGGGMDRGGGGGAGIVVVPEGRFDTSSATSSLRSLAPAGTIAGTMRGGGGAGERLRVDDGLGMKAIGFVSDVGETGIGGVTRMPGIVGVFGRSGCGSVGGGSLTT
jgi:hypothetical protein